MMPVLEMNDYDELDPVDIAMAVDGNVSGYEQFDNLTLYSNSQEMKPDQFYGAYNESCGQAVNEDEIADTCSEDDYIEDDGLEQLDIDADDEFEASSNADIVLGDADIIDMIAGI